MYMALDQHLLTLFSIFSMPCKIHSFCLTTIALSVILTLYYDFGQKYKRASVMNQ